MQNGPSPRTPARTLPHPSWVHLSDSAYFSEQWNTALRLFKGDALFHIQADAHPENTTLLFERYIDLAKRHNIGVYEPMLTPNVHPYQLSQHRLVEPDLYEIPHSDCTCWFIAGDIINAVPIVDTNINGFGWGIDTVVAALCIQRGKACVRDACQFSYFVRICGNSQSQ
jgi:hypothetical protein